MSDFSYRAPLRVRSEQEPTLDALMQQFHRGGRDRTAARAIARQSNWLLNKVLLTVDQYMNLTLI